MWGLGYCIQLLNPKASETPISLWDFLADAGLDLLLALSEALCFHESVNFRDQNTSSPRAPKLKELPKSPSHGAQNL